MDHTIRILLVDDQKLFVESLKTVVENDAEDIEVVGIANDGLEAVELARELNPEIVVMDVRMPESDGVEAVEAIQRINPDIRIVMLTTFDDDRYVHEALQKGAVGYLLKNIAPAKLVSSIRAVRSGNVMIAPRIAGKLLEKAYNDPDSLHKSAFVEDTYEELKPRELEILKLMSTGMGNKQITRKLFLAEQTVRNHISAIYTKLGVHDRYEVIQKAFKLGII